MLNDQDFWSNDNKVQNAIYDAKDSFSENIPYRVMPSSISRDETIIIFSAHFIEKFRLMLSSGDGAVITQMSEAERDVWYSYLEYLDGTTHSDPIMVKVVEELDNCVVNELQCKVGTYLDQALDVNMPWETCPVGPQGESAVLTLTQSAYDIKLAASEVLQTTTYIITLNSVTVKIYLGEIIIWEQA